MSVRPAPGEMLPLVRRLNLCPDPLELYRKLSNGGRKPDSVLLESADVHTKLGSRSIIVSRAALRLECRGPLLTLTALTANGANTLPWIASQLASRAKRAWFQESVSQTELPVLHAEFPMPPRGGSEAERLSAPSPLDALRCVTMGWKLSSEPASISFLSAGVFAYDLIDIYETLPAPKEDHLGYPDFVFWVPELLVMLQHIQGTTTIIAPVFGSDGNSSSYHDATSEIERVADVCCETFESHPVNTRPPPKSSSAQRVQPNDSSATPEVDVDDAAYADMVESCRRRIVAGDIFQAVPSRTFNAPCQDPLQTYACLRRINPSPYMFYVSAPDHILFGASPETFLKVDGSPLTVEIRPIAGTRPRARKADGSIDWDGDGRQEAELRLNEKELAEHMMLVDLARNDVARVCRPGSRYVPDLLTVDRYSHVMHLVSYVRGELRSGLDALHAYAASMNMGTLVGAPKVKAAEILRELELTKRGPYGGAVGYLTAQGSMDTAIVIRAAIVKDGVAYFRAGAGVVYDSDAASEVEETWRKAGAVWAALRETNHHV